MIHSIIINWLFYIIIRHFKIIKIIIIIFFFIFFFFSFFFSAESCDLINVIFSLSMSRCHILWYFTDAFSFAEFKTVLRILLNSDSMVFFIVIDSAKQFCSFLMIYFFIFVNYWIYTYREIFISWIEHYFLLYSILNNQI